MPEQFKSFYSTDFTTILVNTPNRPEGSDVLTNGTTPGYQEHSIFNTLKRNSPQLTVINDGTSILYILISTNAESWSSSENPLMPGESRIFYNVYAIRLRAPVAGSVAGLILTGGVYRITEYETKTAYSGANSYTSQIVGIAGGNPVDVNIYFLGTPMNASVDSIVPLGIGATFFGTIRDFQFSRLGFMGALAFSDVVSAANGFRIQQSNEGIIWVDEDAIIITAVVGGFAGRVKSAIATRFARVAYTNGAGAQALFTLGSRAMIS